MSTQGHDKVQLIKSTEIVELLESRHILDDEIKMVIDSAESTEEKLYQPESNRFLAKKKIGGVTFYVEYSATEESTYTVHSAYSHRMELLED